MDYIVNTNPTPNDVICDNCNYCGSLCSCDELVICNDHCSGEFTCYINF